jgi:phosphatidylglycerophosphate synthase
MLIRAGASPNAISVDGMLAAIVAGVCFAFAPRAAGWGSIALWLLGALLIQARLVANMLDGMVALGRGVASPVGELFNDVPDRVSDSAVLIGIGCAAGDLTLGLGAALAAMATAYVRVLGRSIGAPSEFGGPMAKQHRMALLTALAVLECFTPASWTMTIAAAALWIILLLSLVTTARRLLRTTAFLRGTR